MTPRQLAAVVAFGSCAACAIDLPPQFACERDEQCSPEHLCLGGVCRAPTNGAGGGSGGGGASTGGGAGGGGGAPSLAFAPPSADAVVGRCSTPISVELPEPTSVPLDVSFELSPTAGLGLHSDSQCATAALAQVRIPSGSTSATFYLRAGAAGDYTVTARATGFLSASLGVHVSSEPSRLGFTSPARTGAAGACLTSRVRAEDDGGQAAPVTADTPLTLSASAPATFFSDTACQTSGMPLISAGTAAVTFSWRGVTGGPLMLTAAALPLAPATQTETIIGAVRGGTCSLAPAAVAVSCAIAPPQADVGKTMLLFQATSTDPAPSGGAVRCQLGDAGAIDCLRNAAGATVTIRWQTAETGALRVQHLRAACPVAGVSQLDVPIQAVDPRATFILKSNSQAGATLSSNDFMLAELTSNTNVRLSIAPGELCNDDQLIALEVIEWTGARVTRGRAGPLSGTVLDVDAGSPADAGTTALFFSYSSASTGNTSMCDRLVRGRLNGSSALTFTRSCTGSAVSAISWERVELGPLARVLQFSTSQPVGQLGSTVTVPAVDLTRSLVGSTSVGLDGTSVGEASYAVDDLSGEGMATFRLTGPTTISVQRASSLGTAAFDGQVIELNP